MNKMNYFRMLGASGFIFYSGAINFGKKIVNSGLSDSALNWDRLDFLFAN